MPKLTGLRVYYNTREADPDAGVAPQPKLILHWARGKIIRLCKLADTPEWAKPVIAAAMGLRQGI
jgi:hypothetical protein